MTVLAKANSYSTNFAIQHPPFYIQQAMAQNSAFANIICYFCSYGKSQEKWW